jgi:mannose-6-phosphate isomerase
MVWGGRRLATKLGKQLPDDQPYGESWEISDHPLHRSIVASSPLAGTTLRQLMETHPDELLGVVADYATFPILVKFLDCSDWLSVQVHPDAEAVKKLWPGEGSKTEAWFVIDAEPGSRIYAGLKPGVGEREMRAALQGGTVAECLHSFEPKPGDFVFLPAGSVHAAGGGVLLAEVQETSDATFRLFDWNRRDSQGNARKLHVEEALASMDWDQGPAVPLHVTGFADDATPQLIPLVACPSFELEFVRGTTRICRNYAGRPTLIVVLHGEAILGDPNAEERLTRGHTWLLPASSGKVDIHPRGSVSLLLCHFTDWDRRLSTLRDRTRAGILASGDLS